MRKEIRDIFNNLHIKVTMIDDVKYHNICNSAKDQATDAIITLFKSIVGEEDIEKETDSDETGWKIVGSNKRRADILAKCEVKG